MTMSFIPEAFSSLNLPSDAVEMQENLTIRPIGDILRERLKLSHEQLDEISDLARARHIRFGDAAVALRYATPDQVLVALSEQFRYAYVPQLPRQANSELVMLTAPFSPQAEGIRAIRSQVVRQVFRGIDGRLALAIVSPDTRDGKTFFVANLAIALSQMGGRTLVVDADLRGPRLHDVFNIENRVGLTSALLQRHELQIIQSVPNVPRLHVMPAGIVPPNPLELLERPAFGALMSKLTAHFDHVLVDTPAAAYGTDAQVIADHCGAALLVARQGASRIDGMQKLAGSLAHGSTRLIGMVFNEFSDPTTKRHS
jgi:protein-tyrosine kinase